MIAMLFGRLGIKGIALILGVVAITAVVGGFYYHYQGVIKDNATLKANNLQMAVALTTQREANAAAFKRIDEFAAALRRQQETMDALAKMTKEASATVRRINNVFSSHDFQNLLNKKPGRILPRVNSGTADTLRMFECETSPGGCSSSKPASP